MNDFLHIIFVIVANIVGWGLHCRCYRFYLGTVAASYQTRQKWFFALALTPFLSEKLRYKFRPVPVAPPLQPQGLII